jgi:hypothetical protein
MTKVAGGLFEQVDQNPLSEVGEARCHACSSVRSETFTMTPSRYQSSKPSTVLRSSPEYSSA